MDELDQFARLGADVPDLPAEVRARARTALLARTAQQALPGNGPARRRPTRRLVVAAAAAAAAATAAVVVPLATGGSPAYAVTKQADGGVVIDIQNKEFRQPKQLQATLRKEGVPAVVDSLRPGEQCTHPRGREVDMARLTRRRAAVSRPPEPGGSASFQRLRVLVPRLDPGETLVLETMFDPRYQALSIGMGVIQGPVSPCRPAPA